MFINNTRVLLHYFGLAVSYVVNQIEAGFENDFQH